jgi:hypothetical protein
VTCPSDTSWIGGWESGRGRTRGTGQTTALQMLQVNGSSTVAHLLYVVIGPFGNILAGYRENMRLLNKIIMGHSIRRSLIIIENLIFCNKNGHLTIGAHITGHKELVSDFARQFV